MPSWKKLVVSGSDATLNSLFVSTAVTASIFSGSHIGNLTGTASYVTGSVFNSSNPALSASYALTASYALNAGAGGGSTITVADEGAAQGTATFLNFIGNSVTATVASNTASITITAPQGTGSVALHTQASPAVTWSFNHKLNNTYPVLNVWDTSGFVVIPGGIKTIDANNLEIYFNVAKAGFASAVVGGTALTASYVSSSAVYGPSGFNTILSASYALTSSYTVSASRAESAGNASTIDVNVFGSPVDSYVLMSNVAGTTGVAIGGDADFRYNASTNKLTVGTVSATSLTGSLLGTASYVTGSIYTAGNLATSASFAITASYAQVFPYTGTAQINGNVGISGSFSVTGSTIINTQQNATINTGTSVVATVPTASMYAAFFDYIARSGSATQNMRAGTVISTWNTIGTVQYTDNSTPDIGDTSGVSLAAVANGSNVELRATVTTDSWNIKTFVRSI